MLTNNIMELWFTQVKLFFILTCSKLWIAFPIVQMTFSTRIPRWTCSRPNLRKFNNTIKTINWLIKLKMLLKTLCGPLQLTLPNSIFSSVCKYFWKKFDKEKFKWCNLTLHCMDQSRKSLILTSAITFLFKFWL